MVGIDESSSVRLPIELKDGLIDDDSVEIDGHVEVIFDGEARLTSSGCKFSHIDVLPLSR